MRVYVLVVEGHSDLTVTGVRPGLRKSGFRNGERGANLRKRTRLPRIPELPGERRRFCRARRRQGAQLV